MLMDASADQNTFETWNDNVSHLNWDTAYYTSTFMQEKKARTENASRPRVFLSNI
jgi:hypothetical protein